MAIREHGKLVVGPGGMYCPCCKKMNPTKWKRFTSRYLRRTEKQKNLDD